MKMSEAYKARMRACEACETLATCKLDARFGGMICDSCVMRLDAAASKLAQCAPSGVMLEMLGWTREDGSSCLVPTKPASKPDGASLARDMRKALGEFQREPSSRNQENVNRAMEAWRAYREQSDAAR